MVEHATGVTADGRIVENPKDPRLDQDRIIPLSQEVSHHFAEAMTGVFASEKVKTFLDHTHYREALAASINAEPHFPFVAVVIDQKLEMHSKLDKSDRPPVLKDITDGITCVYDRFVRTTSLEDQAAKFALIMLFQKPAYDAYIEAGLDTGAHTKYVVRG